MIGCLDLTRVQSVALHHVDTRLSRSLSNDLVPKVGVEPTRPYGHTILSAMHVLLSYG
jgi:hypothetical protein